MYICLSGYVCIYLLYTCVKLSILSLLVIYRICICEFAYSLKRICNFICKISAFICSAFTVDNGHTQSGETSEPLNIQEHPSCRWTRCSCVNSHNVNMSFWRPTYSRVFAFLCFQLWLHCLKWSPSTVLKCCLVLLSTKSRASITEKNTWK